VETILRQKASHFENRLYSAYDEIDTLDRGTRDRLPGTGSPTPPSDQDPPGGETGKPIPDGINAAAGTWGRESLPAAEGASRPARETPSGPGTAESVH